MGRPSFVLSSPHRAPPVVIHDPNWCLHSSSHCLWSIIHARSSRLYSPVLVVFPKLSLVLPCPYLCSPSHVSHSLSDPNTGSCSQLSSVLLRPSFVLPSHWSCTSGPQSWPALIPTPIYVSYHSSSSYSFRLPTIAASCTCAPRPCRWCHCCCFCTCCRLQLLLPLLQLLPRVRVHSSLFCLWHCKSTISGLRIIFAYLCI